MNKNEKNIHHYMNLNPKPFDLIKNRIKTIEMRLNDEKRSKIKINDIIVFQNTLNDEIMKVRVINIYHYKDFNELYKHHNKKSIGYKEDEIANPSDMLGYYSLSQINEYKVLGIEIELIEE